MEQIDYRLRLELRSYWHAGTGRGIGALLDNVVHKDTAGLPRLPGRSVKGLVRDAVYRLERWGHVADGTTDVLFGTIGVVDGEPRSATEPGALGFSDATLPPDVAAWLADAQGRRAELLYREVHATAIDPASGTARDQSLRAMEVAVPLTLFARIRLMRAQRLPQDWTTTLRRALPLMRGLGMGRSRGLGRVVASLETEDIQ